MFFPLLLFFSSCVLALCLPLLFKWTLHTLMCVIREKKTPSSPWFLTGMHMYNRKKNKTGVWVSGLGDEMAGELKGN